MNQWSDRIQRLGQGGRPGTYTVRSATQQLVRDLDGATTAQVDRAVDRWILDRARHQARTVARHETAEAFRDSYREASAQAPGVVGYRWTLSPRHPRPDVCDLLANQDLYGLGPGGYPVDAVPATPHTNCIPPGHLIETDAGAVPIERIAPGMSVRTHTGAFRRVLRLSQQRWSGELVVATIGSGLFVATPEHPLLTRDGWKIADQLRTGDQVFVRGGLRPTDAVGMNADSRVDALNAPAHRGEIAVLLGVEPPLTSGAVPSTGVDLDGDLQRDDSGVHVEFADGELRDVDNVAGAERAENGALVCRGLDRLSTDGSLHQLPEGTPLASEGGVGSHGHGRPLFGGATAGRDSLLLGRGSLLDTASREPPIDRDAGDAEPGGDLEDTQPLVDVQPNGLVDDRLECALSGHFALAAVESVARQSYSGAVHNFAVDTDESYCVNGVVAHNCLCTATAIVDRAHMRRQLAQETGGEEPPRPWESGKRETATEWVSRQPRAFQDRLLGPTRGRILRDPSDARDVVTTRGVPIPVHQVLGLPPPVRRDGPAVNARPIIRADRARGQVQSFPRAPRLPRADSGRRRR